MRSSNGLSEVRTQVLVVGAGPVGLAAALALRQLGVNVRVIDQQSAHRARTFPVVLHPQTLRHLAELGVAATLLWRGRTVQRLAVYTEYERRAVLDLPAAAGVATGALTLPQDILRQALANQLEQHGVHVEWNTRLAVLLQDQRTAWGRLKHEDPGRALSGSARAEVSSFEADFVIGADGYESTVREALGLQLVPQGPLQSFAFFDAATQRSGNEAQLALSEEHMTSVYPLHGGQSRFSFQLSRSLHKAPDASALHELLLARLPWYGDEILSCDWSGVAEFRQALAERFGVGRVWLAGEAAHLAGPLGVQSVNVGLDEANELARRMADALRTPGAPPFGEQYNARRTQQWRRLLGLQAHATMTSHSPEWVRRYADRLPACLPASGADLEDLLAQLGLTQTSGKPDDADLG